MKNNDVINSYVGDVGNISEPPKEDITKLFLYRKADEYSEMILEKKELYFNSPKNFNDPFEYYVENKSEEEKKTIISKGVLCLSEVDPTTNTLMWSHYADKHKGVCFEFLIEQIKIIIDETKIENKPKRVEYDKNKEIKPLEYKDVSWEYEKEHRVILEYETIEKNNYKRNFKFNIQSLKAVYLGMEISTDVKDKYKSLCSVVKKHDNHEIELYEMKLAGRYELEKIKIDYK